MDLGGDMIGKQGYLQMVNALKLEAKKRGQVRKGKLSLIEAEKVGIRSAD